MLLIPESQRNTVDALFEKSKKTDGFADEEIIHKRKDGTTFQALMSGATIKDADGRPLYTSVAFVDITERIKMQQQIVAQDRLASIGQLVSGVAHEINNPLTSIIGFSELSLQRDLPDDVKANLTIVVEEAQRTATIVRNLLIFARKQPEGKLPIQINENIQRVLSLRKHEQEVNNIQVNTHFTEDLPQIMGNSSQLLQVFLNIIINAEQAMLGTNRKGTLIISTDKLDNLVRISFVDDGPGINTENMKKLFTPFFTTKEAGKGTGLGLSICQGIISEHGGKIWAESEPGKGATFKIELPIAKNE